MQHMWKNKYALYCIGISQWGTMLGKKLLNEMFKE
jgi:hypothetical protein